MSKNRIRKQSSFVSLSNRAAQDERITLKAKGLLLFMFSFPDGWNFTMPWLQENTGTGRDSLRSAMKELIDAGYIERYAKRVDGESRFNGWEYCIFDDRRDLDCVPKDGFSGGPPPDGFSGGRETRRSIYKEDLTKEDLSLLNTSSGRTGNSNKKEEVDKDRSFTDLAGTQASQKSTSPNTTSSLNASSPPTPPVPPSPPSPAPLPASLQLNREQNNDRTNQILLGREVYDSMPAAYEEGRLQLPEGLGYDNLTEWGMGCKDRRGKLPTPWLKGKQIDKGFREYCRKKQKNEDFDRYALIAINSIPTWINYVGYWWDYQLSLENCAEPSRMPLKGACFCRHGEYVQKGKKLLCRCEKGAYTERVLKGARELVPDRMSEEMYNSLRQQLIG